MLEILILIVVCLSAGIAWQVDKDRKLADLNRDNQAINTSEVSDDE